jgi:hypothetical protein
LFHLQKKAEGIIPPASSFSGQLFGKQSGNYVFVDELLAFITSTAQMLATAENYASA